MRLLLACCVALGLAACGKVNSYTDGGGDDGPGGDGGGGIDAKTGTPDGMPFVCDDQSCGASDSCCPAACNANNDPDCAPACGNSVIEAGETCDPLSTCVTSCPAIGCQLRSLSGGGTCGAQCVNAGQQTTCQDGDGCCPTGCNATNDLDCAAVCGNGVVESGETCDGNCPTSCPQLGCSLYQLVNADTCGAQCVYTAEQGACANNDGCCPAGCNAVNDNDCQPVCGNSVVEAGETCDPCNACPVEATTCWTQTGSTTSCDLTCHVPVQACGPSDTCCPYIQGSNGADCNRGDDGNCAGNFWQYRQITWAPLSWTAGQTLTTNIYGLVPGDSILITTCTPDGSQNTDDTFINSVIDNNNVNLGADDDSYDLGMLTRMAGWHCEITGGNLYLSTAPANDGGAILGAGVYRVTVSWRGFNAATPGSAKLYIWWNGTSNPNPG